MFTVACTQPSTTLCKPVLQQDQTIVWYLTMSLINKSIQQSDLLTTYFLQGAKLPFGRQKGRNQGIE
jgi:hypothetical protein